MDQRWIEMDRMIAIDPIWIGDGLVMDVRWILFGWIEAGLNTSILVRYLNWRWIKDGLYLE